MNFKHDSYLKKGIWLYFYLLIFEGALRKWIFPELSNAILLIRDPLAIGLIVIALYSGRLRGNGFIVVTVFLSFLSLIATLLFGHGNIPVAIYGFRTLVLHFPLIFIIGTVFSKEDVTKIGRHLLVLSIPMTVLIILQFYSPQSAWVNRGVGGDLEGAGFSGALGYFRPPGTFSFTTGNTSFYAFLAVFIFYFWASRAEVNRLILILSSLGLILSITFSISRQLLFEITLTFLFLLILSTANFKVLGKAVILLIIVFLSFTFLADIPAFSTSVEVFTARFTSASQTEGGLEGTLVDRFLGLLFGSLRTTDPFTLGEGIGEGSQVGAKLLTGERGFLIAENEWGRLIGEMGYILGFLYIVIRILLVVYMGKHALSSALTYKNYLPWLMLSFAAYMIISGQWAQATALGFSVLTGGLVLASLEPKP